ncbi:MAG TPA: hypothetical protein VF705_03890, partial [Longimicrobium sp.]
GAAANRFDTWFTRLDRVLVRYVPFPTSTFRWIRNQVYLVLPVEDAGYERTAEAALQNTLLGSLTDEYRSYQGMPTPQPDFIALQPAVVQADYLNLDIPVFYHRVGSTDIVDSSGARVPIPAAITVMIGADPNATEVKQLQLGPHFFEAPPTAAVVQAGQLQPLGAPATLRQRIGNLRAGIPAALGVQAAPRDPGALFG